MTTFGQKPRHDCGAALFPSITSFEAAGDINDTLLYCYLCGAPRALTQRSADAILYFTTIRRAPCLPLLCLGLLRMHRTLGRQTRRSCGSILRCPCDLFHRNTPIGTQMSEVRLMVENLI